MLVRYHVTDQRTQSLLGEVDGRATVWLPLQRWHGVGTPTMLRRREPTLALWCFGEHQGFRLQKLVSAAITLILQQFTIHQRLGKIEASHCSALTGRASEHHTLGPAIWPPAFSD